MRDRAALLLALLMIVSAGLRGAPAAKAPKDYEMLIIQAEQTADLDLFTRLLADDSLTIGPDGKRHSKAEILQILRSVGKQNVTARDFVVLPAGPNTAIVNYVVTASALDGFTRQHTVTSVWVQRNRAWQMVFHQGTEIPR